MCVCVCVCGHVDTLTALWCAYGDELIGLVLPAEALGLHLHLVGGVWLQHGERVGALTAMGVHQAPLLSPDQPAHRSHSLSIRLFTQIHNAL